MEDDPTRKQLQAGSTQPVIIGRCQSTDVIHRRLSRAVCCSPPHPALCAYVQISSASPKQTLEQLCRLPANSEIIETVGLKRRTGVSVTLLAVMTCTSQLLVPCLLRSGLPTRNSFQGLHLHLPVQERPAATARRAWA
jgi:hypothetical protein